MTDRRDLLRLTGFLVALLVVTGAILLAVGGGSSDSGSDSVSGQQEVDGLVVSVSPSQLVLRPSSGAGEMTFEIRATDRPRFPLQHLNEHAAQGLLTRVMYVQEDGRLYALEALDAPEPNVP